MGWKNFKGEVSQSAIFEQNLYDMILKYDIILYDIFINSCYMCSKTPVSTCT